MNNFGEKVRFIWSVADLLRGPYRPNQYKNVMLPLTVLRRLDCLLQPTKDKVLERKKQLEGGKLKDIEPVLCRITGVPFCNTSRFTFEKLKGDPNNIAANLTNYIKGFSSLAREIIEHFGFEDRAGIGPVLVVRYWGRTVANLIDGVRYWGRTVANLIDGERYDEIMPCISLRRLFLPPKRTF